MSEDNKDGEETERDSWRRNLEKILERKERWIKVDDVDVRAACPPGENFAADVFRVVVYGRRLCLGAWTDCVMDSTYVPLVSFYWISNSNKYFLKPVELAKHSYLKHIRKNFIVKRVPDLSAVSLRFCDHLQMFYNEAIAYEDILPLCQTYLDNKSRNDINELSFPKYYGQCHRFLVLQDLQPEGYQLVNRVKGFSMKECTLVLRELSKFHALSFALKKDDRISFTKTVNKLKEALFCEEHVEDIVGLIWENSARFAVQSLEETGDFRFKRACEALKTHSGRILRTLIDLIKPDYGKFEVLCHGDLWSNNVLLRYCDSGYPVGVKFIDLQAMRYSSCVLDVMHILFTSSRPVIFERYFTDLLSEYYTSLGTSLKNLDESLDFTFDEFMTEFKRKIPFGIYLACLMLTCVTRTSPFDPSEMNLTKKDLMSEEKIQKMYESLTPGYHERLRGLFLALTDANLI